MALQFVLSIVVVSVLAKIGEKMLEKIGEYVVAKIGEYVVGPVGDFLVAPTGHYLVAPIRRQLDYLRHYKNNIEDFKNQIGNLGDIRDRVQGLVDAAERKGRVILPNVRQWLTDVNEIIEESSNFLGDEIQVNLRLRYQRSRSAEERTAVVAELKQKGCSLDRVSDEDTEVFEFRNSVMEETMKETRLRLRKTRESNMR